MVRRMNQSIDDKTARVSDILEQIDRLNTMILFHRDESGEESMRKQYESMRHDFLQELKVLLASLDIKIIVQDTAA